MEVYLQHISSNQHDIEHGGPFVMSPVQSSRSMSMSLGLWQYFNVSMPLPLHTHVYVSMSMFLKAQSEFASSETQRLADRVRISKLVGECVVCCPQ